MTQTLQFLKMSQLKGKKESMGSANVNDKRYFGIVGDVSAPMKAVGGTRAGANVVGPEHFVSGPHSIFEIDFRLSDFSLDCSPTTRMAQ